MTNKEIYKALRKALDEMHKEEEAETLAYFKRELLKHLNTLKDEAHTERIEKAIFMLTLIAKSGYPVGTVRTWRGTKFKKIAQGKWRRVYDSETRGAKMSIARLKKQVEKCESVDELFDIVMNNTHRFSDANGKPLAIVKELKAAVDEKKKALNADKPSTKAQIEHISTNCKKALKAMENPEKLEYVDYTRKNYNKLFPRGEIETPIGKVKLGEHQFERLAGKDGGARTNFLAAMYQTLTSPICVIEDTDNQGRKAKLFIGYFKDENGDKGFFSVTPTIDGLDIQVSFGVRKQNKILHKIKRASSFLYVKEGGRPDYRTSYKPLPVSQIIKEKNDSVNGGIVKYRGYTIRDIKDGDKGFENMDREKYVVIETPRGNTFMLPVLREKAHNFIDEAAKDAIEEAEVYAKVKGYGEQERLMLLESYAENQKTKRGRAAKRILKQVKRHGDVDFDSFEKHFLVDINEGAKG